MKDTKMPEGIKKTHGVFFTLLKASLILYSISYFALLSLNFLKQANLVDGFSLPFRSPFPTFSVLQQLTMWAALIGWLACTPMGITTWRLEGEGKVSSQVSFPCPLLQGPLTLYDRRSQLLQCGPLHRTLLLRILETAPSPAPSGLRWQRLTNFKFLGYHMIPCGLSTANTTLYIALLLNSP